MMRAIQAAREEVDDEINESLPMDCVVLLASMQREKNNALSVQKHERFGIRNSRPLSRF
jgi:hypothetical protein